jgi:hypothetical protein
MSLISATNIGLRIATLSLALELGLSRSASAQTQTDNISPQELFLQGREEMDRGNYEAARASFERSQRIEPALGTLLNLAVCEERLGKLATSLADLQKALTVIVPTDKRRTLILERITQLDRKTPRLAIGAPEDLDPRIAVTLDSKPIDHADFGKMMRIDPGLHDLRCAGPRGERCTSTFAITEGEMAVKILTITVPVASLVDAKRTHPTPNPLHPIARDSSLPYAIGAFGLAGVTMGLIAGLGALHQKNVSSTHCDTTGCDDEGFRAEQTGKTFALVSTVATSMGAAGLGASAYLLLSGSGAKGAPIAWSVSGSF